MNVKAFVQHHPLTSYLILAYGITWGSILILLASKGFQFSAIQITEVGLIFLFMLAGPSTSSLVLTWMLDGRAGWSELWSRIARWRVGGQWYAVALLTIPVLTLVLLTILAQVVSPEFAPGFQIVGLVFGLMAGFFEELGWTGFATPRLLKKFNVLTAGFVLGLAWALWHLLADFSGNISTLGANWLLWFVLFWLVPLMAYRILMTWVYTKTGSLLVAQLMHASYTGWLFTLSPAISSGQSMLWQIIFAAGLWVVVAVVVSLHREQLTRKRVLSAAETS
jgi:membrane protease YdiL (CAAX protease family)